MTSSRKASTSKHYPDMRRLMDAQAQVVGKWGDTGRVPEAPIPVSRGEEKLLLPQKDFLRFYADGKGVSAQTAEETYAVRLRLYELEEQLDQVRFVRISNGEIVNYSFM